MDQDGVDDLIVHMDGQIAIYSGAALLSAGSGGTHTTTYDPIYFADLTTGYSCTKYYLKRVMTRVTLGDVNGDGEVTVADANMIVNHYTGNLDGTEKFSEKAADMNGDGEITIADANEIVNMYVGQE